MDSRGNGDTALADRPNTVTPPPTQRGVSLLRKIFAFPALSVIVATVALVVIIGIRDPRFFQITQLFDILQASTYVALLAMGLAFLIAMRDIDLSVGSSFALCLIIAALLIQAGWNPWIAAAVAIAAGLVLGLINATLVAAVRIPTLITTLATMSAFRGLAIASSNGQQIAGLPTGDPFFAILGGQIGPIPVALIITVIIMVILSFVLNKTPFGYRVLAIGSNPEAAAFSGISIRRVRTQLLALIGLLAGISAVLGLGYFTSGDPTIGGSFALEAIAAAVIGGTPLRGGRASILGAFFGAVLLNVVTAGLPYFGIQAVWSEFATGVAIVIAVGLNSLIRYRQNRSSASVLD